MEDNVRFIEMLNQLIQASKSGCLFKNAYNWFGGSNGDDNRNQN